jgi:predicted acylesterase/phospholipase RssA
MNKCLAFVLRSGSSRGAMEVGALRALLEAGFHPDSLVGTWIGAVTMRPGWPSGGGPNGREAT